MNVMQNVNPMSKTLYQLQAEQMKDGEGMNAFITLLKAQHEEKNLQGEYRKKEETGCTLCPWGQQEGRELLTLHQQLEGAEARGTKCVVLSGE